MAAPAVKTASKKSRSGAAPTPKPPKPPIHEQVMSRFLALTGFALNDINGTNSRSYIFVTKSGGKYQMDRKGKQIKVLMGPPPPKTSAVVKE